MKEVYDTSRKKVYAVIFISCITALTLQYWKITEHFDWALYDMQMPLWSTAAPDDVVIIAIDDKSIERIGRWPWSRSVHAQLIDMLSEFKTGPVVLNILFSEPTRNNTTDDIDLAQSISRNKQVILPITGITRSTEEGVYELLPIPELLQAAHSIGHSDLELDIDSKFRRVFLYAGLNEARWPNLAAAALFMSNETKQLPGQRNETSPPNRPNIWVRDYYVMIPLIGAPKHFKTISYADVLEGSISSKDLSGKYIFIGSTAKGLNSGYATSLQLQNIMSGVEIQANIFEAIRQHKTIREMSTSLKLLLTFILSFIGALLISRNNWAKSPLYLTGLLIVTVCISESLLIFAHTFIPIVPIGISLIISSLSISLLYIISLQDAVDTDALTGLSNRRFFDNNFKFYWRRGKRYQRPFSLLLIDIDFLKATTTPMAMLRAILH
ncbi:MAG: CHASE2 domain-containing protein [gamma proteobacterium symbiont of Bathyaustriella thionipta]|nr:CHASE2 domain-containing protein [gamma proteobacterium symbiont of Bathyaustriella thionipta]MCU7948889.1 CHASE2 domain-containing protein [gamma proteobacterium symbiont of Bathyaustriella thionipta]MCU7952391.1 CHASE2 domain-containing protein [gamma proteobacterium symbiont of Bathyaustriella thionipta]MCU7955346.1 CHASE2 domain-containing protein [gamma proteobacterium symbiont of Bathyaustriella thionipta]MCU7966106.1 CHASE2 domain-containing protein [gamma proteobacterium symbiont of 